MATVDEWKKLEKPVEEKKPAVDPRSARVDYTPPRARPKPKPKPAAQLVTKPAAKSPGLWDALKGLWGKKKQVEKGLTVPPKKDKRVWQ